MKTIRLAMICPIPDDPTSFYRGVGPFTNLQKIMPELQLLFPNPVNWASLKLADIVFLQRPCSPDHFNVLAMAKDLGKPVWVDFDDDNLVVPKDNPQFHVYNQMPVKEAIVKLARHADVLTVSTENLQKKYCIYNKNTFIIPNALDNFLLRHRNIPNRPHEKMILWRGTPTHKRNLDILKNEIIELANNHKDWNFSFFGYDPIDITDHYKNHTIMGANGPIDTYKGLTQVHALAGYYVLANNEHAQARSHICWIEYTFASMLSVLPKTKEFTRPGTLNYENGAEFKSIIESVIKGEVDVKKHVEESWECIQSTFMLHQINNARKQLIEQLINVSQHA